MRYFLLILLFSTKMLQAQVPPKSIAEAIQLGDQTTELHLKNPTKAELKQIAQFKNLEILTLEGRFDSLPDNIVGLSKLRLLRITSTSFKGFPKNFYKLSTLQELKIDSANLDGKSESK